MRWRLAAALVLLGGPLAAQPLAAVPETPASAVLTIDQDRLFAQSRFGQRVGGDIETASRDLATENRHIEGDLAAEEAKLADTRKTTPPGTFRPLADAFDAKVTEIRRAQKAKARAIETRGDEERQRFFATALPILGALVRERGAAVILDNRAVFLATDAIDITDEAIARIDADLGDGVPAQP